MCGVKSRMRLTPSSQYIRYYFRQIHAGIGNFFDLSDTRHHSFRDKIKFRVIFSPSFVLTPRRSGRRAIFSTCAKHGGDHILLSINDPTTLFDDAALPSVPFLPMVAVRCLEPIGSSITSLRGQKAPLLSCGAVN